MTAVRNVKRNQAIRMHRFFMAAGSCALWTLLSIGLYHTGFLRASGELVSWLVSGVVATNLLFFALLKFDINLRLGDPSMTREQILAALFWVLAIMFMGNESRGVMITLYLTTLLFGVFKLSVRQFANLAVFAFVGYLSVVVAENLFYRERTNYTREFINSLVLSAALGWAVLFGSYIRGLRQNRGIATLTFGARSGGFVSWHCMTPLPTLSIAATS